VSPEEGFTLKGMVAHAEGESSYAWNSPDAVRRSLFMDDILYTISKRSVVMTGLDNGSRINEVLLPYRWETYPTPYPVW